MAIKQDIERAENSMQEEIIVPLIPQEKTSSTDENGESQKGSKGHQWMVYLSTFVAVCGSFAFGSCVILKLFILNSAS